MSPTKFASILTGVTFCLGLLSCSQTGEKQPAPSTEPDSMAISRGDSLAYAGDSVSHAGRLASFPDTGLIKVSFTPQPGGLFAEVGLKNVYDAAYLFGEDSLHLFMTVDKGGGNYLKLVEYASQHSQVTLAPAAFQFDDGYSLVFNHSVHGRILAGLKSGWLLGCIGYNPVFQDFVGQWVGQEEEAGLQNDP